MNAPSRTIDPWQDLSCEAVVEVLTSRGWPVKVGAHGVSLSLGYGSEASEAPGFAILVTTGPEGEAAWKALSTTHPNEKLSAPRWREDGSIRRVVRQGSTFAPTSDLVPGITLIATGTAWIPPSVDGGAQTRWLRDSHAATTEPGTIPEWVAAIALIPKAQETARAIAARAVMTEQSRVKPGNPPTGADLPDTNTWELQLVRSGRGVKNTFGNLCKIFRGAPEFTGKLRLNDMTQKVEVDGESLPEDDIGRVRELIEDAPWGGFAPGKDTTFDAIRSVASERRYHPVREYLTGLTWDGENRLDRVLSEVLRVPEASITPVMRAMVRKWFISAVARALQPGEKVDTALVLQGAQGLKKSTFFEVLGGVWYGCTEIRIGDKDGLQQIHANWLTEWGEIDRITNARHAGEVKAFIARQRDDFRPPYGRNVETYLRSCVIVGSVNPQAFLNDPTGSRRFWVIRVVQVIDISLLRTWRDQLWAEAVAAYQAGELFYLDDDDEKAREEAADAHRARDPWEAEIGQWARRTGEDGWRHISMIQRRPYLQTIDVLRGALKLEAKDCRRETESRAADVLRTLGYVSKRVRLRHHEVETYETLGRVDDQGRIYAWVLKGEVDTPELRAADEVVFGNDPEDPAESDSRELSESDAQEEAA